MSGPSSSGREGATGVRKSAAGGERVDVPTGHRVEHAALMVVRRLLAVLPERVGSVCGSGLGWAAGSVLRVRRRAVDAHLRVAFPERTAAWRARVARRSYVHLGREFAAFARMGRWSPADVRARVELVDFDPVLEAAEGEAGAVLLTAHLGNWEAAGAGIAALGVPLVVVGKGMSNRLVQRDVFAHREGLGMRVVEIGEAPRAVFRSLGGRGVVALLWDQNDHRGGLFAPFFGNPAATHRGPARFALRTGAPVFAGFALRQPGWRHRYELRAHRLEPERTGRTADDEAGLLAAYNALLEGAIRQAPEQYFWQHRRWKTRPRGSPEEPSPRR